MDDIDVIGALGYHTQIDNKFLIRVGVETTLKDPKNGLFQRKSMEGGRSVSDVVAHEILETIGNPFVNREIFTDFLPVYYIVDADSGSIVDLQAFAQNTVSLFRVIYQNEFKELSTLPKDFPIEFAEKIFMKASVLSEVVNPVQANKVDEVVNNRSIEVADFITPQWFDINSKGPFNYKKTLPRAFELDIGGYVDFFLRNVNTGTSSQRFFMYRVD